MLTDMLRRWVTPVVLAASMLGVSYVAEHEKVDMGAYRELSKPGSLAPHRGIWRGTV